MPILILVELKGDALPGLPTRPVPFGKDEIDSVDAEILSVFQKAEILTPDRVRGRSQACPRRSRPRAGRSSRTCAGWSCSHWTTRLGARPLPRRSPAPPRSGDVCHGRARASAAAWFKINDPIKDLERIQKLVREGFLVRTRADADTVQSRRMTSPSAKRRSPAVPVHQHRLRRARPAFFRLLGSASPAAGCRGIRNPISGWTRRGPGWTWRGSNSQCFTGSKKRTVLRRYGVCPRSFRLPRGPQSGGCVVFVAVKAWIVERGRAHRDGFPCPSGP